MELRALKYGDLMGSPDTKAMLHAAGPGTEAAHALWEEMARRKLAHGWTGRCTSVLLLEPSLPEVFPAVVDLSFVSADPMTHGEGSVTEALQSLEEGGVRPEEVRSFLVTHPHVDHFDPRVLEHLPAAKVYGPAGAGLPGCSPATAAPFGEHLTSLETPGHGGPHVSFVVDLPEEDLSVAIAGDLVMSHAHYLAFDHPLSFADHEAGRASLEALATELDRRPSRFKMVLPGHDRPFFFHWPDLRLER